jgi:hypothetical protein
MRLTIILTALASLDVLALAALLPQAGSSQERLQSALNCKDDVEFCSSNSECCSGDCHYDKEIDRCEYSSQACLCGTV